jgi:NAD(P)-dependent dehydrogenase (short-subunit alcohol dehydrogenase family)
MSARAVPNRFDIANKVVVVTGSTKGLGAAIALAAAEAGARVVVSSKEEESICSAVAARIAAQTGAEVVGIPCHVGNWDEVPSFVDEVHRRFGKVDVLVNNAGISQLHVPLVEMSSDYWDKLMSVNVKGALRVSTLMVPRMAEAKRGSIVNISSIGAYRPHAHLSAYDASKAALCNLTQVMAAEWAPMGIRVNAVLPGPMKTEMMLRADEVNPGHIDRVGTHTMMQRVGLPEEIVGVVLFLASEASSYVTGADHYVCGGLI